VEAEIMVDMSVVRLGPNDENVSATLLRTALVSHFQGLGGSDTNNNNSSAADDADNGESIDDHSGLVFRISNKYFTANVLLEDIGATTSTQSTTTTTIRKEDGVILVFDALQSNPDRPMNSSSAATFDSLSLAHEATENNDGAGDLLRLCVGVSLTSPSSPEELRGQQADKEYSRRILWCLDRGYEYVEADLSQEGQAKGHGERDKEGFARIVEAIQGTVWSSAVMLQSKTKQLKDSYQEDKSKAMDQEEKEEENPYEPPDPSKFGAFSSASTTEEPPPSTALSAAADEDAIGLVLNPEEVGPQEIAALRQDLEADQLFEKMEGVLREASKIRDASKTGEMTDDQRRDRAGDAAMALVNLMTQFGLDEDDGSQMDSSDDDSGVVDGDKK
jgi:hypothetical protein